MIFRSFRLALSTALGLAAASAELANPSFEVPADGADAGWRFEHAGVVPNDGSFAPAIAGADGDRIAYLAASRPARLIQDLDATLRPDSVHTFRLHLGFRPDERPAPGSSLALHLQTLDPESGRPLANLAITTVIAGRENLSAEALAPFEVSFTTGPVPPPGRVRLLVDTVQTSPGESGQWLADAASWEISARPAAAAVAERPSDDHAVYRYNEHIRPIFTETCFACHGPDPETREARLRLDLREEAIAPNRRGRIAIVPGDPEASTAYQRIISTDEDEIMPPPAAHKVLSGEQIEMIRQWIADGAIYEEHWAYEPIVRPPLPEVSRPDWPRQPLDAFVLEKLDAAGLEPAPEADPRTLARRAAFDLTGLPPSPEMLEEFLNDPAPDAYERYVDRLLAMPQWGEHRGRHWLDVARYADTHGIHFDNYREIWGYRDWVIDAFNRNLPFDQFTIEQIAGDLLPEPTEQQLIATGYNRCNITTNEGGVIEEEYRVLYSIDRTDAMATAWLGLTASCAACHDHKYDPFPSSDFYSLAAFFNNSTTPVMDGNRKDPFPTLMLFQGDDRAEWEHLEEEIPSAEQALRDLIESARGDLDSRLASEGADLFAGSTPEAGLALHRPLDSEPADGPAASLVEGPTRDSRALLPAEPGFPLGEVPPNEHDQPFSLGLWLRLESIGQTGSLVARLDDRQGFRGFDLWFQGGQVGAHLVHSWADDAIKIVAEDRLEAGRWHHVALTYDGSSSAAGLRLFIDGAERRVRVEADSLRSSIRTEVPLRLARREVRDAIQGLAAASFHYFDRELGRDEVSRLATDELLREILAMPADERDESQRQRLLDAFLARHLGEAHGAAIDRIARLQAEREGLRERTPVTHIFQEAETLPTAYVLHRGEYDARRDRVPANTPSALPPMAGDLPRNRMGLARWLVSEEQPLTARVTTNRFWLELFGQGLVTTPGDFGFSGQMPSHPELLDWLASEFREGGWDVKAFYRMLVTSATYRQAAVFDAARMEKDPANILLSRGPRFRLDAEMIRDQALAASGLLVPLIGGPSVRPYQPDGVWEAVAMFESNTRNYRRDEGDSLYRRSLYTFWKRAAPPAAMEVFNAPNREVCTVQRERSNTPLQALAGLNDPQLVEAARHLATHALLAHPDGPDATAERCQYMALRLLARPLRPEELAVLDDSLAFMLGHYRSHPDDAAALISTGETPPEASLEASTLAAWTILANELLNLDETLTK